jgi:hypothetical protein
MTDLRRYGLPCDQWTVETPEGRLGKNLDESLYNYASEVTMTGYWRKKRNWTNSTFSSVAWDPLEKAMLSLPRQRLHWIGKHVSGVCGVNSVLLKWKQREDDHCPRCGAPETANHVWQCQGSGSDKIWEASLNTLDTWLISVDTDTILRNTIIDNLRLWISATPFPTHSRSPLAIAQDLIGWQYLIEGILPQCWVFHQHTHYRCLGQRKQGRRWATQLILKLFDIAWDLWEHRNGLVHRIDQDKLLQTVDTKIKEEVQDGAPSRESSHLFSEATISRLDSSQLSTKQAWLSLVAAYRLAELRSRKNQRGIRGMQTIMQRFIHHRQAKKKGLYVYTFIYLHIYI